MAVTIQRVVRADVIGATVCAADRLPSDGCPKPSSLRAVNGLDCCRRCCAAPAATPPRLLRPRRPDTELLAGLEVTDPPPATRTVGLTVLTQARTSAPEILVAEGHRSLRTYPMGYASFLVEHPRARLLVAPSMCSTPHRRVLPFPVPLLVAPDLFGDGSVLLLDMAGHTPGSIGVLLAVDDGTRVLLAGDAVWGNLQIRLLREKAPMPGLLFDADRDAAFAVVRRLHALPEGIEVIAGHDHAAITARIRN